MNNDGTLGEKTLFAKPPKGVPDGLVVSEDGAVWVALAGGGHGVAVFAADSESAGSLERSNLPFGESGSSGRIVIDLGTMYGASSRAHCSNRPFTVTEKGTA